MAFKSFSEKSKAKRGLLAFAGKLGIELTSERVGELLCLGGLPSDEKMKWGFEEDDVNPPKVDTFTGAGIGTEMQPLEAGSGESLPELEEAPAAPVAGANLFNQLIGATSAVAAPAAPRAPAASRGAYTIEKDRPEQNGIKRPSAGGLCRAVWDECDALRTAANGEVPTTKQIRESAATYNWNENNALIEFYQWRKFNGITGRAKKVEAPAATETATA